DSPIIAKKTGAMLVGSSSAANVGKGYGLTNERIIVVRDGDSQQFGKFKLTFIFSAHSPGDSYPGTIDVPLALPARASDYRTGDCYSLLVEHEGRSILVHGSAGFIPGALAGRHAD